MGSLSVLQWVHSVCCSGFTHCGECVSLSAQCTGKTYTMEGPSIDDDEKKGIIPRMVNVIFDAVMDADDHIEFSIRVCVCGRLVGAG